MNMELKDFIKGTTVVEGNRVWHLETFHQTNRQKQRRGEKSKEK